MAGSGEKKTLTTGEVAEHCGVSSLTVIGWIKSGRLEAYQLPGRGDRRIKPDDFVRFLVQNNMPVPDEFKSAQRKVLVVDDEEYVAFAISRALRMAGYETMIAPDGFTAGRLLESFRPSVMTLDIKMPGLNGIGVLKTMRKNDHLSHVRVLVVSGLGQKELEVAFASGADDVLQKPFDNDVLLEKISALVGS